MLQLLLGASLALLPITGPLRDRRRRTSPASTGRCAAHRQLCGLRRCRRHLIAPTIVLAVGPLAQITSMVRSSMLDELGKPYVAFSQAVGMPSF